MLALRQDLRFAMRTLGRSPGWIVGVVLTLSLGIGLATAVFTIAESLILQPLPVRAQERLVVLWGVTPDGRTDHFPLLYEDAREYARRTQTLQRVEFFAYGGAQPVPIRFGAGVVRLRRSLVSGGYFDLLGTRPLLGRALRPQDDATGAAAVAVLSFAGWQHFFGGDPAVIGRQLVLHYDGKPYTVVGVMPLGLDYPQGVDFWTPIVPSSGPLGDHPIYAELNAIGRLRSGSSIAGAREELTRFFASTTALAWHVRGVARSLTDDVVGDVGPALLAFAAAAGLLLLISCFNVANLLIIRGLARSRELAVRAALGASHTRLIAQLLTESAILAVVGGLVGAALAAAAVRGFVALAPAWTPRLDEIRVTGPVIFGAIAITSIATLLFSLAPSVATSRVELQDALRTGARQSGGGRRFRAATQALVVGQVALALLVLSAAGLVARSLLALRRVDVAFDPSRLLVAELALPDRYMGDARKQIALLEQVVPRLQGLPEVRSVAPVLTPPLASVGGIFGRIPAEGQSADEVARNPALTYELATPLYFATLGISLERGRLFTNDDRKGSLPVAILSESAERYYWPGGDAIGKRLVMDETQRLTVVGVVRDTHYRDLRHPRPSIYFPLRQSPFPFAPTTLVIATAGGPAALVPSVRRVLAEVDAGVAVASAVPLEAFVADKLAQPKLNALLLTLFAGAALALAAVGLFGVMATTVRQRTREIAIRVALGATPAGIRAGVLREALLLLGAGGCLGLGIALAVTRLLRSLLFGVSPNDPLTLACGVGVLAGVALLAAYLPARRASRIDPAQALRAEV